MYVHVLRCILYIRVCVQVEKRYDIEGLASQHKAPLDSGIVDCQQGQRSQSESAGSAHF